MNDLSPLLAALGQTLREERQKTLNLVGENDTARQEEQRALTEKLGNLEILVGDFGRLVGEFSQSTIKAFNSTAAATLRNSTDALFQLEDKVEQVCGVVDSVVADLEGFRKEESEARDRIAALVDASEERQKGRLTELTAELEHAHKQRIEDQTAEKFTYLHSELSGIADKLGNLLGRSHENEDRTDGLAARIESESLRLVELRNILNQHIGVYGKHLQVYREHLKSSDDRWGELEVKIETEIARVRDSLVEGFEVGQQEQAENFRGFQKLANLQMDALEEAYQKLRSDHDQGRKDARARLDQEMSRVQGELQQALSREIEGVDARLATAGEESRAAFRSAVESIEGLQTDLAGHAGNLREHAESLGQRIDSIRDTYPSLDRWLDDGQTRAPNAILSHRGGVWQARVSTQEEPGANSDWDLLVDGIHAIRQKSISHGELQFIVEFASGRDWTGSLSIPLYNYVGRWKDGTEYAFNDVAIDEGHNWVAGKDNPEGKPSTSKDWHLLAMRGARGRKGDRGERGADGHVPPIEDVVKQWREYLESDDAIALNRYRGAWEYQAWYDRGDLISMGRGLFLSTAFGSSEAPPGPMDEGRWLMLVEPLASGGGGGGAGGGGHVIQDTGVDLPQRAKLNFVGNGVIAEDDEANDTTKVTISGAAGNPVADEDLRITHGLSLQKPKLYVVEDAGSLYIEVERDGGGNLDFVIDGVVTTLDCTTGAGTGGRARATLTPGVQSSEPVRNAVYVVDAGGGVGQLSTSIEHPGGGAWAWVGIVQVPDAVTFLTSGPYVLQRFTEAFSHNGRGALSYEREKARVLGAVYATGGDHTLTIVPSGAAPDSVHLEVGSAVVYQLHRQTFPAFTTGPYNLGNGATRYSVINNLNEALTTSDGQDLSGRRFNLVLWGAVNQETGDCKLFVNLPTGSYNSNAQAQEDRNNTADYSVPSGMQTVAFLIARIALRHRTQSNGTWTELGVYSLLGSPLGAHIGGSGAVAANDFADAQFSIYDDNDPTRVIDFEAGLISPDTIRTITVPDADVTLALDGEKVPAGGTTGQVLAKGSNTNFDTQWATVGRSPELVYQADLTGKNLFTTPQRIPITAGYNYRLLLSNLGSLSDNNTLRVKVETAEDGVISSAYYYMYTSHSTTGKFASGDVQNYADGVFLTNPVVDAQQRPELARCGVDCFIGNTHGAASAVAFIMQSLSYKSTVGWGIYNIAGSCLASENVLTHLNITGAFSEALTSGVVQLLRMPKL